jgi:hypothetical protein
MTQIVERILSFSVTSPVVKFLTGLELLLEKAQVRKNLPVAGGLYIKGN